MLATLDPLGLAVGIQVVSGEKFEHWIARPDLARTRCSKEPDKNQPKKIAGVYAGNPKRETATPKAEIILCAFQNIYLTTVQIAGQTYQHITPLNDLQKQILALCELPTNLYDLLFPNLPNPYPK